MAADTAILVEEATKVFTLRYHKTFKQMTVAMMRGQDLTNTFTAVDNVSLEIKQGESVGLMGLNGSGKSTLLKMINGTMRPDKGTVLTRGRIAGLIATGAGFHPQLSGRENIYLNAAIMGMSEKETARRYDEIVDFADIGKFLEAPVGTYSSGMYARLGFSVAVHVDSDIFLADEVLAVGDKPFKKKCMDKMEEIRQSGVTIVYVSHAAGSVARMCERVIVLEQGKLGFDGEAMDGIRYVKYDDDLPVDALSAGDGELGADI